MKKLFVAVALVMGMGTSVALADNVTKSNTEVVSVSNEFVVIELKDVPQAVQDAVAKNYAGTTIKEAQVKSCTEGKKTYKLVLVNAEQMESTVLFNENGEEIKEKPAE